jgi:hypothetical protein
VKLLTIFLFIASFSSILIADTDQPIGLYDIATGILQPAMVVHKATEDDCRQSKLKEKKNIYEN